MLSPESYGFLRASNCGEKMLIAGLPPGRLDVVKPNPHWLLSPDSPRSVPDPSTIGPFREKTRPPQAAAQSYVTESNCIQTQSISGGGRVKWLPEWLTASLTFDPSPRRPPDVDIKQLSPTSTERDAACNLSASCPPCNIEIPVRNFVNSSSLH